MSERSCVSYGHDLMVRGRVLAENRLIYLQELYDSGRWRRYHGEQQFVAMVRETRIALDKWCSAAPPSDEEMAASPILAAAMRAPALVPDEAPPGNVDEETPVALSIDDAVIDAMALALAEDEPMPLPVDLDEVAARPFEREAREVMSAARSMLAEGLAAEVGHGAA